MYRSIPASSRAAVGGFARWDAAASWDNGKERAMLDSSSVPLTQVPAGADGVVLHLDCHGGQLSRLAALGFSLGVKISVVQNQGQGPLIVCVRHTRVALDRAVAGLIRVEQRTDDPTRVVTE
jgi:Fe2+ transport system protein FeoA